MSNNSTLTDTFVFYPSFLQQVEILKDEELQLKLLWAICRYGVYGTTPDFTDVDPTGMLDSIFIPMKISIDDAKQRRRRNVENGKKGGAPLGSRNNPHGRRGKSILAGDSSLKPMTLTCKITGRLISDEEQGEEGDDE